MPYNITQLGEKSVSIHFFIADPKVDRTRKLINTHQPLVKTDFFSFKNNSRPL